MPEVLMKNGEVREVPLEEMVAFLTANRDQIQDKQGKRKRKILSSELVTLTNTK